MNKLFCFKNIPNILTISRIIIIPIILVITAVGSFGDVYHISIYQDNNSLSLDSNITLNYLIAGILFVIACFTDWLDGFISRKYNLVSDFGKIWDPLADKILVNSIFILFSYLKIVPWYFTVLIVARDIIVDGFRIFLSSKSIVFPAKFSGKVKTVLQMIAIIILFFAFNDSQNILSILYFFVQNLFVIFAVITSLYSCFEYMKFFISYKKSDYKKDN